MVMVNMDDLRAAEVRLAAEEQVRAFREKQKQKAAAPPPVRTVEAPWECPTCQAEERSPELGCYGCRANEIAAKHGLPTRASWRGFFGSKLALMIGDAVDTAIERDGIKAVEARIDLMVERTKQQFAAATPPAHSAAAQRDAQRALYEDNARAHLTAADLAVCRRDGIDVDAYAAMYAPRTAAAPRAKTTHRAPLKRRDGRELTAADRAVAARLGLDFDKYAAAVSGFAQTAPKGT